MEDQQKSGEDSSAQPPDSAEQQFDVVTFEGQNQLKRQDDVVVEEPVEIRIVFGPAESERCETYR